MDEKDFPNCISVSGCVRHWRYESDLGKFVLLGHLYKGSLSRTRMREMEHLPLTINLMKGVGLNLK